jgi:hypothetical protein
MQDEKDTRIATLEADLDHAQARLEGIQRRIVNAWEGGKFGVWTAAQLLGVSEEEARAIIQKYRGK